MSKRFLSLRFCQSDMNLQSETETGAGVVEVEAEEVGEEAEEIEIGTGMEPTGELIGEQDVCQANQLQYQLMTKISLLSPKTTLFPFSCIVIQDVLFVTQFWCVGLSS